MFGLDKELSLPKQGAYAEPWSIPLPNDYVGRTPVTFGMNTLSVQLRFSSGLKVHRYVSHAVYQPDLDCPRLKWKTFIWRTDRRSDVPKARLELSQTLSSEEWTFVGTVGCNSVRFVLSLKRVGQGRSPHRAGSTPVCCCSSLLAVDNPELRFTPLKRMVNP